MSTLWHEVGGDEAPADDTEVLAYVFGSAWAPAHKLGRIEVCVYSDGQYMTREGICMHVSAWMPLVSPPDDYV